MDNTTNHPVPIRPGDIASPSRTLYDQTIKKINDTLMASSLEVANRDYVTFRFDGNESLAVQIWKHWGRKIVEEYQIAGWEIVVDESWHHNAVSFGVLLRFRAALP